MRDKTVGMCGNSSHQYPPRALPYGWGRPRPPLGAGGALPKEPPPADHPLSVDKGQVHCHTIIFSSDSVLVSLKIISIWRCS